MAQKLPSGKYRSRAYYYDEAGKRRARSFTAKTKREADYLAAEFERTHREMSQTAQLVLKDAAVRFIDESDAILSPSTIRGYNVIRRNYLDDIQDYRLCDLTPSILQRWMNNLARTKSPKTCKNAWGLMCSVLKRFYPEAQFTISLPQKRVTDVIIPQKEDIEKLLDASKNSALYPVILLGAHMGLRRSEIAALTWDDIDLKKKTIRINKALVPGEDGLILKQPKTIAGTRTLNMTRRIYEYFSAADRTLPPIRTTPDSMTTDFRRLCKKLDMPFHQHLLRHYFASVCASQGLPESYAAMLMGHSSYEMIRKVYGHILDEEEQKARRSIISYFDD